MLQALCRPGARVVIYNGRQPAIAGTVVGVAFHASTTTDTLELGCVIQPDRPIECEDGILIRYVIAHPHEFEELPH